jgi:hypothetical protein
MARNNEKGRKREVHNVGPGVWRENLKSWKITNTHYRA